MNLQDHIIRHIHFVSQRYKTNGHVSGLPADIGVVNTTTYTLADAFMRQDTKRFNVYRGAVSATIGDFSLSNGSKSLLLNQLQFVDTKNNDLREIIQNVALVNKYSGTVVTYANVYKKLNCFRKSQYSRLTIYDSSICHTC